MARGTILYTRPEEAVIAFDELYCPRKFVNRVADISNFLNMCSPSIREEIRPVLEMMVLIGDTARFAKRSDYAVLLTEPETAKGRQKGGQPRKFKFPFKTRDYGLPEDIIEKEGIIGEPPYKDPSLEEHDF